MVGQLQNKTNKALVTEAWTARVKLKHNFPHIAIMMMRTMIIIMKMVIIIMMTNIFLKV